MGIKRLRIKRVRIKRVRIKRVRIKRVRIKRVGIEIVKEGGGEMGRVIVRDRNGKRRWW